MGFGVGKSLQAKAESQPFVHLFSFFLLESCASPPRLSSTFHHTVLPCMPFSVLEGGDREVVEAPSLETSKTRLDRALGNLI